MKDAEYGAANCILGDDNLELNWSTFILEIINFLILLWILKHFLYQPVLDVIARRRAGIEKTLEDAQTLNNEALALQEQYENRLMEWEQERQAAKMKLDGEVREERERQMIALRATLEREQDKVTVVEQRRLEAHRLQSEKSALAQGAQFTTKLLSALSGPELESRLIDLLLDELASLPAEQLSALRKTAGVSSDPVLITSAHSLDSGRRQALESSLGKVLPDIGPVHYEQDEQLLAGLRINLGAWRLSANLQDELKAFTHLEALG